MNGLENRFNKILLHITVSAMSSGGFRTTHFNFSTNDNRKHRTSR